MLHTYLKNECQGLACFRLILSNRAVTDNYIDNFANPGNLVLNYFQEVGMCVCV